MSKKLIASIVFAWWLPRCISHVRLEVSLSAEGEERIRADLTLVYSNSSGVQPIKLPMMIDPRQLKGEDSSPFKDLKDTH